MDVQIERRRMRADELFMMPDDGFRYELVRGELRRMSPTGEEHGLLVTRLTLSLGNHVEREKLGAVYTGEPGFKLRSDPDTVRAPDLAFVRRERLAELAPGTGYRTQAPDLVAEVISPGDLYAEVDEKVSEWLEAGVAMVLVVNPRNRTVRVYYSPNDMRLLREGDVIEGGDVVPGWTLALDELFAPV
jgi:Uma2 family endonuclease